MEKRHKRMDVWKLSMSLVKDIYMITESLPKSEQFGLFSQMRRSAVSIPSNIAEGAARQSDKEFARFLLIARGSLMELDTQLTLSEQLHDTKLTEHIAGSIEHLFAKLSALISKLKHQ